MKVTLGIDVLRCQSPEMVRREIWTALLAYNLIRQTMLESAKSAGQSPRQLSFTAALQKIAASWVTLPLLQASAAAAVIDAHLSHLESQQVGDRPTVVRPINPGGYRCMPACSKVDVVCGPIVPRALSCAADSSTPTADWAATASGTLPVRSAREQRARCRSPPNAPTLRPC
jgi:hypothetical protein